MMNVLRSTFFGALMCSTVYLSESRKAKTLANSLQTDASFLFRALFVLAHDTQLPF